MNLKNFYLCKIDEFLNLNSKYFQDFDLSSSYEFCKKVTQSHYENFPVGSLLLPKEKRKFLHSIYAFSRLADDIADSKEINFSLSDRLTALDKLEKNVQSLKNFSTINNPIFLALKDTIERKELPIEPFLRLLTAFKMDVNFKQPYDWNDLESYCSYSANPVGELVLRVFQEFNNRTIGFSNQVCTGLQLVNFWQDLSIDLSNGRVYIPRTLFEHYKVDVDRLSDITNREKVGLLIKEIIQRTYEYFLEGWKLVWHLKDRRLKYEINATILGGMRILKKEEKLNYALIFKRPKLKFFDYIYILLNAFI